MREIKFRALKDDMSNCNFVYGSLTYNMNGVPRIHEPNVLGLFHTCIKGTEGQWTGLKDKNGVEIYEGDKVEKIILSGYAYGYTGIVKYNTDLCKFYIEYEGICGINSGDFATKWEVEDGNATIPCEAEFVVIGNIHQNK